MFSYNDWAVIGNIGTVSNVMMLTLIMVMAMVMIVVMMVMMVMVVIVMMMVMMVMVVMMRQVMSKCHECEFLRNSFHHNAAAHGLRYTGRFALMISNIIITIIFTTPINPSVTFVKVTKFRIVIVTVITRLDNIELNFFEGQCSGKIQSDGASIQVQ